MESGGIRLFNLETMSGVYPGTRTQRFQRIRLVPLPGSEATPEWAVVLWYDDPPACVVVPQETSDMSLARPPILRIEEPASLDLNAVLMERLAALGWRLAACGACAHWRAATTPVNEVGQFGECLLRTTPESELPIPVSLAAQSHLALACPFWEARTVEAPEATSATLDLGPLPRIAVITESKLKPWQRWQRRLRRRLSEKSPSPSLADQLAERSGVGAGTEPCFVCHGRIANLGALTVESHDGDKQTFSVWRCRDCLTLYLSDWIDRWERVDSLETEETIYRIPPAEAAELLTLFLSVPGGDHPERRSDRSPQRDAILGRFTPRHPLSHVVKQGR